jgi:hypothetical protein
MLVVLAILPFWRFPYAVRKLSFNAARPPYAPGAMATLSRYLSDETAVMLEICHGMRFWNHDPGARIVGVFVPCLTVLNHEQLERFLSTYNISAAMFYDSDQEAPAIEFLKQEGFEEIHRSGKDVVLVRTPPAN